MRLIGLSVCRVFAAAAGLTASAPAIAGPIPFGEWLQFSHTSVGVEARGCNPEDLAGEFCFPSSGTPTSFLDAPPWTFTSTLPTVLTVTEAFLSGDQFSVLDLGVQIGTSSVPGVSADCGDDPAVCLGTPGMSSGVIHLAPGSHSLTIVPLLTSGSGTGFLRVDEVPEPATGALIAFGLVSLAWGICRKEVRK